MHTVAPLRSRIGWLREGDTNTGLFHLHAQHYKRKNFITKPEEDDRILTSHDDKDEAILDFYSNLIGSRRTGVPPLILMLSAFSGMSLIPWMLLSRKMRFGIPSSNFPPIKLPDQMVLQAGSISHVARL
uniref:Uncharacterized protein n=1 Tax=Arundo donax TaxID=35708 RepID=A0A0A9CCP4_ARUDO